MLSWLCMDCETLTADYYTVHDHIWLSAVGSYAGMLCLPCLEKRLDRRLIRADFKNVPVNTGYEKRSDGKIIIVERSQALIDRFTAT